MQVSAITILLLFFSVIVSLALPIGLFLFFRKKEHLKVKPVVIGALVWVTGTQILENGLHFLVLGQTTLLHFPIFFALYAGLSAGLVEEIGRYFAFKKILTKDRDWGDGMSYGIGHGGIEAIMIGFLSGVQYLLFAFTINLGNIAKLKSILPKSTFVHAVNILYSSPLIFLFGGIERFFGLIMQIALSMLVLLAIKKKKIHYLLYAIGLHALFDFAPALYQTRTLNLWIVEVTLSMFGIGCVLWLKKTKELFQD